MNPDEIRNLIEASCSDIVSKKRNNPDGWAFYYKEVRYQPKSTRIARALQSSESSPTYFKRSVSANLGLNGETIIADPTEQQVKDLFAQELQLWHKHYQ